jgi:hypothetical protein
MSIRTGSILLLALGSAVLGAPSAHAKSASFKYEFKAKQTQVWASAHATAGGCFFPVSGGTGTTESIYTAKGNVEVTGKVKRPSFTITPKSRNSKVKYTEHGTFVLDHTTDSCYSTPIVEPFPTTGCGSQTVSAQLSLRLDDGELEVEGTSEPRGEAPFCPLFFYGQQYGGDADGPIAQFTDQVEESDHDLTRGGMLSTIRDVKGRQFFKGRDVVLKDERAQDYNEQTKLGLTGRTQVEWTLRMTPRDD